ncbi:MAG: HD-GYP domain-containing protein [Dictyoglomus sp.]|uniref:HD-GYP domain-containing protein n=1 Tax=Dictyoglomus sp. TaxID=28205 RepID=UPI003D114A20
MYFKDEWIGIFILFTPPQSEEEFRILKDLSEDLSYVIYSLRVREEKEKINKAYETIFKISPIGLIEVDLSEIKNFMKELLNEKLDFPSEEEFLQFFEEFMKKLRIIRMNEEVYKIFEIEDRTDAEKNRVGFIKNNLEILKENLFYISLPPLLYEREITIYTLKKNKKTLKIRAVPFPGCEEEPSHVILVIMDITEEKESIQKINRLLNQVVETLAEIVEKRDPYTAGHQKRVAKLAFFIGKEMGLSEEKLKGLYMAGLLHDIGKIAVPTDILNKPGKLDPIEFELIKKHPEVGYEILKNIEFPYPVAEIVLEHHERINGSGYPKGLKDGDILIEARILAVSDVVEAMSSHRPYRPAFPLETALREISEKKGILYDEEVVDACIKLFKEKNFRFE